MRKWRKIFKLSFDEIEVWAKNLDIPNEGIAKIKKVYDQTEHVTKAIGLGIVYHVCKESNLGITMRTMSEILDVIIGNISLGHRKFLNETGRFTQRHHDIVEPSKELAKITSKMYITNPGKMYFDAIKGICPTSYETKVLDLLSEKTYSPSELAELYNENGKTWYLYAVGKLIDMKMLAYVPDKETYKQDIINSKQKITEFLKKESQDIEHILEEDSLLMSQDTNGKNTLKENQKDMKNYLRCLRIAINKYSKTDAYEKNEIQENKGD